MFVPEAELKKEWYRLWMHLLDAYKKNPISEPSKFDSINWQAIKGLIECALNNVENGERVFSRSSQISTEIDPSSVFSDIFAELKCVPYLLSKGFKNIRYNQKNNVDFVAEFNGSIWGIEVAYIRGPNFKTQSVCSEILETENEVYCLGVTKLIMLLNDKYLKKQKQVLKHGFDETNAIIFLVTDLEETDAVWLDHDPVEGKHPIDFFVTSVRISTILFGRHSVYESDSELLKKLPLFSLEKFNQIRGCFS
jgi:hypothetical protein